MVNNLAVEKVSGVLENLDYMNGLDYQVKFADDGTYTYVGRAKCGVATSAARWSIKRIENSTGDITWAYSGTETKGSSNFTQIWDDRTSLSYS